MIARKGPDSPDTSGSSSSFKNLNQRGTEPNSDPTSIQEEYQQFAVQNPIFHPHHPLAFLDNRINHDVPNKPFSSNKPASPPPISLNKRKQGDSDSVSSTSSDWSVTKINRQLEEWVLAFEKEKKELKLQQQKEQEESNKRRRERMLEHNRKHAHAPHLQV